MGEAFYEPIDDMGPERTPKAVEVLDPLAEQWQKGGYDVRWLFRTILNTQAYQRRVRSTANEAGKTPFASSCPSRLAPTRCSMLSPRPWPAPGRRGQSSSRPRITPQAQAQGKNKSSAVSLGDPKRAAANVAQSKTKAARQEGRRGRRTCLPAARRPVPCGAGRASAWRSIASSASIPRSLNEDVLGTIPQALFLMNSPLVNNRTRPSRGPSSARS